MSESLFVVPPTPNDKCRMALHELYDRLLSTLSREHPERSKESLHLWATDILEFCPDLSALEARVANV